LNDPNSVRDLLKNLFASQRFAVLATQGGGQPYGSLVAFAADDDLGQLFFATARGTRKYRNLAADSRVALVVDSRSNREEDLRDAVAVTAVGEARELPAAERDAPLGRMLARHPSLGAFLSEPDAALMAVRVDTYCLVSRFEDVVEFRPASQS
jgi:nitroimidazol reductase NimA-like FMN-containing flavoprotein (pyridoxamine 5'-phosphate oxidase superfamily)